MEQQQQETEAFDSICDRFADIKRHGEGAMTYAIYLIAPVATATLIDALHMTIFNLRPPFKILSIFMLAPDRLL